MSEKKDWTELEIKGITNLAYYVSRDISSSIFIAAMFICYALGASICGVFCLVLALVDFYQMKRKGGGV